MVLASVERGVSAAGPGEREQDGPRRLPLSGVRVLVADDDRIPRRIAVAAVVAAGGIPVEAADGPTALAVWSSKMGTPAFEAAVLDFVMPGMDGADLVRALRALGYKGTVLGLTAAATEAQIDAWIAAGCDEVLPKGCSTAELVTELVAAYRRRRNGFRFKPR